MNFLKLITIIFVIAGLSTPALAARKKGRSETVTASRHTFNYNYVEGGFADNDFDSGLAFRGSYSLNDQVFLAGTLMLTDLEVLKVGAGYRFPYNRQTEFYAKASYADYTYKQNVTATVTTPTFPFFATQTTETDVGDNGLELSGGARYKVDSKFELGGGVNAFLGDNSDTGIFVNGTYKLDNQFGISLEIKTGDFKHTFISGRYNF